MKARILAFALFIGGVAAVSGQGDQGISADAASLVAGNNQFALELYQSLAADEGAVANNNGNLFISPYSLSTALAMTYAGARGRTAEQMADVLHFSLPQDRLHQALAAMLSADAARGAGSDCQLHVANALWGQQGHGFLDGFLDLTRKHYGAAFHEVDFV